MKPETDPMPRASEPSHDHNHWELSPIELRVRALEFMQVEKGYVEPALLMPSSQRAVKISPCNGAQVVARAGASSSFKRRLRDDATAAIGQDFLFGGRRNI